MALIDIRQAEIHERVSQALSTLSLPLMTTHPCFTETLYLVGRSLGYPAQFMLWQMRAAGKLMVHLGSDVEMGRCEALMAQYRDAPMDYADASLVAAAETLGLKKILTLDSHFYAYRLTDGNVLEVVP